MYDLVEKHRRKLPHLQLTDQIISLTWRLAFTLPRELLLLAEELREGLRSSRYGTQNFSSDLLNGYAQKLQQYDEYLGRYSLLGLTLCTPEIGNMISGAFHCYSGKLYELHCFCVMPNHVHVLLKPLPDAAGQFTHLSRIVQLLKSYTARQINQLLAREGQVWQSEYFDRFIRNSKDYYNTVQYILDNPRKAGLCVPNEKWPYVYYQPGLIE